MNISMGGAEGSGDDDTQNSLKGRRSYQRLNSSQQAKLEKFIRECPHPDDNQRRQLAREIGLEPRQIKFWFQNKRTQMKAQTEKADNTLLRIENDRIQSENLVMGQALKTILCESCGGPPYGEEEHQRFMQQMQLENAHLKSEHEKVSNLLVRYLETSPTTHPALQPSTIIRTSNDPAPELGTSQNQPNNIENPCLDQILLGGGGAAAVSMVDDHILLPNPITNEITENMEKALMLEIATNAIEELVGLVSINEPLWVKSSSTDGKFVLDRQSYEAIFPRVSGFRSSNARVESSKDSRLVSISGVKLVDMFLDSEKWVNLFPTIVTKAQTIQVLESGLPENRSGALQLMYEEMHVLSPLVASREFCFLRYCQQVEANAWVITDVSFDYLKENTPLARSWRLPSGCMIQEMPNGSSMVTWVEHVEVDDKVQTHRLYRDVVCNTIAYGAERWLMELQRMCERISCFSIEKIPSQDPGGVINTPEGRRSVMKLCDGMVKGFCGILNMSGEMDFPNLSKENNSGVRISVRSNTTEAGQPYGLIVIAATSIWLPLPPHYVFDFFRDDTNRPLWDVLCCGNPVQEIAHISNGIHPANRISILRPFIPSENGVVILQESYTDPLGSYVIYAPSDVAALNVAIMCDDSLTVPILPSGFIISGDGLPNIASDDNIASVVRTTGGSLLTVAFQVLACSSPDAIKELGMESIAAVNTLATSTVQKVKEALNCSA